MNWAALIVFGLQSLIVAVVYVVVIKKDQQAMREKYDAAMKSFNDALAKRDEDWSAAFVKSEAEWAKSIKRVEGSMTEHFERHDRWHKQHFDHAKEPKIHQETMPMGEIRSNLAAIRESQEAQAAGLKQHIEDDARREERRDRRDEKILERLEDIADRIPRKA